MVTKDIPSLNGIKDDLLRMILLTNLEDVRIKEKAYNLIPVLKLTTGTEFSRESLNKEDKETLKNWKKKQ